MTSKQLFRLKDKQKIKVSNLKLRCKDLEEYQIQKSKSNGNLFFTESITLYPDQDQILESNYQITANVTSLYLIIYHDEDYIKMTNIPKSVEILNIVLQNECRIPIPVGFIPGAPYHALIQDEDMDSLIPDSVTHLNISAVDIKDGFFGVKVPYSVKDIKLSLVFGSDPIEKGFLPDSIPILAVNPDHR
eukprot:gene3951-4936_t